MTALDKYRTSLSLNNKALWLMQRGRCEDALQVLNDSSTLLKDASYGSESTMEETSVRKMLDRASTQCVQVDDRASTTRNSGIQVVETDEDDLWVLQEIALKGLSSSAVHMVRMSACTNSEDDFITISRQFASLCYNKGVACIMAQAKNESFLPSSVKDDSLLDDSLYNFRIAERTLSALVDMDGEDVALVLIHALVLRSLGALYKQIGLKSQARETMRTVSFLCRNLEEEMEYAFAPQEPKSAVAA